MQYPEGASFNSFTLRMELSSFTELIFSHDAQSKFVHTSIAGFVPSAVFLAGVSAIYMLQKKHLDLARRSFRVAAPFGLLSIAGDDAGRHPDHRARDPAAAGMSLQLRPVITNVRSSSSCHGSAVS
jgi:hypothetical protein